MDQSMKNKFCQAAMQGDWAAMGAYADYLEERDGDKAFIAGLRFCVKYRKFPNVSRGRFKPSVYYWNCCKVNKVAKDANTLPLFMEHLVYTEYNSPKLAISAVGRTILQIHNVFNEII
jgi:hypothetical protein